MKVFVLSLALMLVATAVLYLKKRTRSEIPKRPDANGTGATQDLVSFAGFDGPLAVRTDGARVAFIAVSGKKLDFLTDRQWDRETEALEEAFAATDHPFIIHRVTKPLDPTESLRIVEAEIDRVSGLEDEAAEAARRAREEMGRKAAYPFERKCRALSARRRLLEEVYLPRAMRQVEAYRVESYVTMAFDDGPTVQFEANEATSAFMQRLMEAGYDSRLMGPNEIIGALMAYYGRYENDGECAAC